MILLDGRKTAEKILSNLKKKVKKKLVLAVVLVGENPVSEIFIQQKKIACEKVGIHFKLFQFPTRLSLVKLKKGIEKIIKNSRERYATSRQEIEEKIAKWSGVIEVEREAKRFKKPLKKLFDVVCSNCGKKTQVSFEPDGVRPVFCPECLEKARNS